jgi:hypothetical protein
MNKVKKLTNYYIANYVLQFQVEIEVFSRISLIIAENVNNA